MKNLIIAILMLSALTAYFSYCGENVPFERTQKEGWAFFGGDIGSPIPQAGKDGEMEAFLMEAPQEQKEPDGKLSAEPAPQKSPITVSVEYPKAEKGADWEMFFVGVAAGVLVAEIATALVLAVLFWIDKKKSTIRKGGAFSIKGVRT
jgi:hypothetical protein